MAVKNFGHVRIIFVNFVSVKLKSQTALRLTINNTINQFSTYKT